MANPYKTLTNKNRAKKAFSSALPDKNSLKRYGKKYQKTREDKFNEFRTNCTDAASTRYNSVWEDITMRYCK